MGSIACLLALVVVSAFTGAAVYIHLASRMRLDAHAQLTHWTPAYDAGLKMQLSLVIASSLLGLTVAATSCDWRWLVGAVVPAN